MSIFKNKINFTLFAGLVSILVGIIVLIGWYFDLTLLKSFFPNYPEMKANTAVCFLFLGISLFFLDFKQRKIVIFFALCTFGISFLTLMEFLFHINLGIDEFIFMDVPAPTFTVIPGRMSIVTAINFFLLSTATLLKDAGIRYKLSDSLSLLAFFNSFFAIIAFIVGINQSYNLKYINFTPVALNTAILFIFLSTGILYKSISFGYLKILISKNISGIFFRKLSAIVLTVIPLFSWVIVRGRMNGYYDWVLTLGLFSISTIFVALFSLYYLANLLETIEIKRLEALETIAVKQREYIKETNKIKKQIEEKNTNLEKMNSILVGRELKMIELKKQIKKKTK